MLITNCCLLTLDIPTPCIPDQLSSGLEGDELNTFKVRRFKNDIVMSSLGTQQQYILRKSALACLCGERKRFKPAGELAAAAAAAAGADFRAEMLSPQCCSSAIRS